MWILDLIAGLLGGGGVPGSLRAPRDMTRAQSLSYGVGTVLLPVVGFVLVLFAGLWQHPMVALVLLPAGFALLTGLLSARLGNEGTWTLTVTLFALFAGGLICAVALVLGALAGFYHDF